MWTGSQASVTKTASILVTGRKSGLACPIGRRQSQSDKILAVLEPKDAASAANANWQARKREFRGYGSW